MYVESKLCSICLRELPISQYHKDKSKKDGIRTDCKDCVRARLRAFRRNNLDYTRQRDRLYFERKYKEKRKVYRKQYYQRQLAENPDYREEENKRLKIVRNKNPEHTRILARAHKRRSKERNPQIHKLSNQISRHRRRARKRQSGGIFTKEDWITLVARSPHCYWCKRPWTKTRRPTHDHVVPLSKGGKNSVDNSVCACMRCNTYKGASAFNPITGQGILI